MRKKILFSLLFILLLPCIFIFSACDFNMGGNTEIESISISQEYAIVYVGDSIFLSVSFNPSNAKDKTITWTTSDAHVATVDNGTVNAISVGTAEITATTSNNLNAICTINVNNQHEDITNVKSGNFVYNLRNGEATITAFTNQEHLTEIIVPASLDDYPVKTIESFAFSNQAIVQDIVISEGIEVIGANAFENCTSLQTISLPSSLTTLGVQAFSNCVALQTVNFQTDSNITVIATGTFYNCKNLKNINIPESVIIIASWAFQGCSGLESIAIPNSVSSIGESAFSGCSNIQEVHIGSVYHWLDINNFDSLLDNATLYVNDMPLTEIKVSDFTNGNNKITSIKANAFSNQKQLLSVEILSFVTCIGDSAFYGCASLDNLIISDGKLDMTNVKAIAGGAFRGCRSLTSIYIPSDVTSIGDSAFYGCTALEAVTFGENSQLESIGGAAFYNCDSLTSIEIPSSVTSIGDRAFYSCGFKSIVIPKSVVEIGESAFTNCISLSVYCEMPYEPSGWSKYWDAVTDLRDMNIYWYSETSPTATGNYWHYDENGEICIWE